MVRRTIELDNPEVVRALLGVGDRNLREVRDALDVEVVVRNDRLHMNGAEVAVNRGARAFTEMLRIVRTGNHLGRNDVERILNETTGQKKRTAKNLNELGAGQTGGGVSSIPEAIRKTGTDGTQVGRVKALTKGQERYMAAIQEFDVVFAIGPAGTGKTYLAVTLAIEALAKDQVNRLILVRPAVEAGEHLGFLPGDLSEKVNPYLRPLYDALHDLMSPQQTVRLMERGVIEVAPLAFMRGRTLNNAFVIMDEAQNTTPKQMKMFLTRLGRDARAVITGDVTQVDLPDTHRSGLAHARDVLDGVKGVGFVHLEKQDIVRHPLVQRIVDAYEIRENEEAKATPLFRDVNGNGDDA